MAARIAMTEITTNNSIIVNPERSRRIVKPTRLERGLFIK